MSTDKERVWSAFLGSTLGVSVFALLLIVAYALHDWEEDVKARKFGVSPPQVVWVSETGTHGQRFAFDQVSRECFIAQDGILNDVSLTPVNCAAIGVDPYSVPGTNH